MVPVGWFRSYDDDRLRLAALTHKPQTTNTIVPVR